MGLSEENILQTIFGAVEEVNKMLPEDRRLRKLPNTVLLGDRGNLDSLEVINFIVELEGRIKKNFNLTLNLIELLDLPEKPMESIGGLAKFIKERANGEAL